MTGKDAGENFEPFEFFVIRTPLFPFNRFLEFGEGLETPASLGDLNRLAVAIDRDRLLLRGRLREIFSGEEACDALWIGSPDLHAAMEAWKNAPDSEQRERVERSLYSYFARMTSRCTPFGLFAGYSLGRIGEKTNLAMEGLSRYHRLSRLDMECLHAIVSRICSDSNIRKGCKFVPNSSLYAIGGSLNYAKSAFDGKTRYHELVSVEETEPIRACLKMAEIGETAAGIAVGLVKKDPEITSQEAEMFVGNLIETQLLVPELSPPLTGLDPRSTLVEELKRDIQTEGMAGVLEDIGGDLREIDAHGIGVNPGKYGDIAEKLKAILPEFKTPHMIQVDLMKPAPDLSLGQSVAGEIIRGVKILAKFPYSRSHSSEDLRKFATDFIERYESQEGTTEVPLVVALDEDMGIGFGNPGLGMSPLLGGLDFPQGIGDSKISFGAGHAFLLRQLGEALFEGRQEINLDSTDLAGIETEGLDPLPDSFSVTCAIMAESIDAISKGDYKILFRSGFGPPGGGNLWPFLRW